MDKQQLKKIINNPPQYDESKEDTIRQWFIDGYSKKMRWITFGVCALYAILAVPMVISVVGFFGTDQTKYQILYAAIFLTCSHWMGFESVFAWVMMQRPRHSRERKRLELCIAELIETIKEK
jgi:small-conductance mechanosensitive channel